MEVDEQPDASSSSTRAGRAASPARSATAQGEHGGGKSHDAPGAGDRQRGSQRAKGKKRAGEVNDKNELTLLEKLAQSPYSSELHLAHIASAENEEEKEEARAFMAQMVPLTQEQWLSWIEDKKKSASSSLEGKVDVLELYKRACSDILSIKLHEAYARFVLQLYFEARGYRLSNLLQDEELLFLQDLTDESAAAVFDEEFVDAEMLAAFSQSVQWHLAEGQSVWLLLQKYEDFRLRQEPTEEAIRRMEQVYLTRLSQPHLQISQTHQMFSSFVSTYQNARYEQSLVSSQPIYAATKATVDAREQQEDRLVGLDYCIDGFRAYLEWEQEVSKPDFLLVKVLYERALSIHSADDSLWKGYVTFLLNASHHPRNFSGAAEAGWPAEALSEALSRAVRYLPFSGEVVSKCIRGIESSHPAETAKIFAQAQCQRLLDANDPRLDVDSVTSIIIACADLIRHTHAPSKEQIDTPPEELVSLLESGIAKVKKLAENSGDPHLRLEKYLLRQYEKAGDIVAMDAFLASLGQSYPHSALVLVTRVDHLLRQNKIDTVRKLFQNAAKKRYDYPEFVFDAWTNFEHRDGTLASLEKALTTITHEMTFVNARRLREARLQATADELPSGEAIVNNDHDLQEEMNEGSKKRRLDGEAVNPESATVDHSISRAADASMQVFDNTRELKRDRENSTISVTGLAKDTNEESIARLFRDCGNIREIKFKILNDQAVATVEFDNRESIPAALTKDKKRIEGQEVQVSPVWQSTLYITNFPEHYDAADIQKLFEPFGEIFETRWPSRRLKSTRRFVYVQYIDATATQRALTLHDTTIDGDASKRLQVRISDPLRKQTRSDANASKRELYITGLHKSATEADVEKLFAPFGTLRGCRVLKNEQGECRGTAFVDFETEQSASAALNMNNYEYKKRRLAVVLADSRVAQKANGQGQRTDLRNRTLLATGFRSDAQEPLVQQFFDKFGRTTAIKLEGDSAEVIFEDPADAARLLLGSGTLEYDGYELTLTESQGRQGRQKDRDNGSETAPPVATFLPRAGRGRGRKLGIGASRHSHHMDVDTPATSPAVDSSLAKGAGSNGTRSQADFRALLLGGSRS